MSECVILVIVRIRQRLDMWQRCKLVTAMNETYKNNGHFVEKQLKHTPRIILDNISVIVHNDMIFEVVDHCNRTVLI